MTERQPHTVSPESQSNNLSKRTPLGRQPGVTEDPEGAIKCLRKGHRHLAATWAKPVAEPE